MSHNPPTISDFDGDYENYELCLGAYEQGYIAGGNNKSEVDNPFPPKTDMNWFWTEGFHDIISNLW